MNIQLEAADKHSIRSYSDTAITIGAQSYEQSIIINRETIISTWLIHSVFDLHENKLEPILNLKPDIIIIGHSQPGIQIPHTTMQYLSKKGIGLEAMSIGAACRTFNLLLSEQRRVVMGVIF